MSGEKDKTAKVVKEMTQIEALIPEKYRDMSPEEREELDLLVANHEENFEVAI